MHFCSGHPSIPAKDRRTLNLEGVWGDWLVRVVMRTCDCPPLDVEREMRVKDIIAHLFDYHVMEKRDWTLDQLVAWVETWEPKDDFWANLSPEIFERISQREEEMQGANDWQARVSAFAVRHKSRRRGGSGV